MTAAMSLTIVNIQSSFFQLILVIACNLLFVCKLLELIVVLIVDFFKSSCFGKCKHTVYVYTSKEEAADFFKLV